MIRWSELINLKTEEEKARWIKKFCDDHKITSPYQLRIKFKGIYNNYLQLSKKNRSIVFFQKKKNDWSELRNLKTEEEKTEWIKNFCNKHKINSPTQLAKDYPSLKSYYLSLSEESRKKIFTSKLNDWSELKTLNKNELVEWFINLKEKEKITSPEQLGKDYPGAYKYYCKLSKKNRKKIFPPKHEDWSFLNNLKEDELVEWFISLKEKEKITSPRQMGQTFSRAFRYYCKLSKENKEKIFPHKYLDLSELKNLKTEKEKVEWIIKFNKEHKITCLKEINGTGIYTHYCKLSEESKEKIFPRKHRDWSELRNLKTEEEKVEWIIKLKEKENLISSREFYSRFAQVYNTCYLNLSKENKEKIFPPTISHGEETLGKLLTERGYVFTTQKDFPDLRSDKGGILRYDVYIEQKNCLIEFHGSQHFNPKCKYYSEEGIERDKIKYQYAKDHNIPLFYITDCIEEYEINGYFAPVLIDWNKLMEKIDSIPDVIVDAEDTAQN